jgi:acyl carrier protein
MLDQIADFIKENYEIDTDVITEETELGNDLGLSSFQLIEMCGDLEDEFDIEISEERMSSIITVGDLMRELSND